MATDQQSVSAHTLRSVISQLSPRALAVNRGHIRTWELLRFHSKLEKSSDEVEDVKDDRPIGPHPSDRPFGLASNPLGEDSPCRIISIRLPQKKTPASTSATSTCFAAARAQRCWL